MARALLLVDIQNDYFPGGAMELSGMEEAAENARRLLLHGRATDRPTFHVQHVSPRPDAGFFLPDTRGVEIHEAVRPAGGELVTRKHVPNAFCETTLTEDLRRAGVDELVICGAMSHMCIDATTRAAFDLGFSCTVVQDACATRDLDFEGRAIPARDVHGSFMAALGAVYAKLVRSRDLLGG